MKAALAVFAASFAYFAFLRSYGLQVEDEGTLMFALARVLDGDFPYVDFHTGYTPGFFYLGAAMLGATGSANGVRIFIALVNAASATGLYAVARRFVGPWMAAVAPALWVAFIPAYSGEFASFNVPYPAWFATLAWVLLALALAAFVETGAIRDAALAGTAAACAFAIKPNAGAFGLAAATWVVTSATRIGAGHDRVLGFVASAAMGIGVWFAFGVALWSVDALFHLVPLVVLVMLACGPLAGRYADPRHPHTTRALTVLAAAFALPTLSWAAPVFLKLGARGFATEVLLIGSEAAQLYYQFHPPPEPYAIAVVLAAAGFAAGGLLVRGWRVSPMSLLAAAAVASAAVGYFIARVALMPEGVLLSISLQLENAAFWLAPLTNWAGVALLFGAARRYRPIAGERLFAVLVPCATAMYWQLYPRTDFMHVAIAVPLTTVLGTVMLARVSDWWMQGAWPTWLEPKFVINGTVACAVAGVVLLETAPVLASGLRVLATAVTIDTPRLRVKVETDVSDDLVAFSRTAEYIARNTSGAEPVLPFPAVTGLLFASGARNPVPHDYWFPGRPSHADERRMLESLRASPPRLVATLNEGFTYFIDAPEYFLELRQWVVANYRLVARAGRFDVLARADVAPALPRMIELLPAATPGEAADAWMPKRRQNARRWMANLKVDEAANATLPADEREAILLVRALRDGGDLKAAGWLIAAYGSKSARLRAEARSAMVHMAQEFEGRRFRWADDLDVEVYRRYVRPYARDAERLAKSDSIEVRKFAAELNYVLGTGTIEQAMELRP